MSDIAPPANWYQDPSDPTQLRFWDGGAWTARTAPLAPPPAAMPVASPTATSSRAQSDTRYVPVSQVSAPPVNEATEGGGQDDYLSWFPDDDDAAVAAAQDDQTRILAPSTGGPAIDTATASGPLLVGLEATPSEETALEGPSYTAPFAARVRDGEAPPEGKAKKMYAEESGLFVILLCFVTLGIYFSFWQYRTYRMCHDHTGRGIAPGPAALLLSCSPLLGVFGSITSIIGFELSNPWAIGAGTLLIMTALVWFPFSYFVIPAQIDAMYAAKGLEQTVNAAAGFWFMIPLMISSAVQYFLWFLLAYGSLSSSTTPASSGVTPSEWIINRIGGLLFAIASIALVLLVTAGWCKWVLVVQRAKNRFASPTAR